MSNEQTAAFFQWHGSEIHSPSKVHNRWESLTKRSTNDVTVHIHRHVKDMAVRVVCMQKGKSIGLILFDAHNDVAGASITYVECSRFDSAAYLLAGLQAARSMRIVSRKTYVDVRERIGSVVRCGNTQKRNTRHLLTRASSAVIANIMGR